MEKKLQTCKGITIIKMFLSLSDKTCLTNVMPVPIRTIVMNKTDPFNLNQKTLIIKQKKISSIVCEN